jgi:hypothetical protein
VRDAAVVVQDAAAAVRDAAGADVPRVADDGTIRPCEPVSAMETSPTSDVFGTIVRFAGGKSLPAGHYRVEYVDGCMKYSGNQGWSVHAYRDGTDAWWLVGETTSDRIVMPPGTVGFLVGAGGFATFDACVAANRNLAAAVEFDFKGGRLGVWLRDDPYVDNIAGENGRNPRWKILFPGGCLP